MRGETRAAIVGFDKAMTLHHGAHRTVEDKEALREQCAQFSAAVGLHRNGAQSREGLELARILAVGRTAR
jgi:hypothetical protein